MLDKKYLNFNNLNCSVLKKIRRVTEDIRMRNNYCNIAHLPRNQILSAHTLYLNFQLHPSFKLEYDLLI